MKMIAHETFRRFLLAALLVLSGCATLNHPTGTIERHYYADGPWAVTVIPSGECCDAKGNAFDLYQPGSLGANGFLHPIVTWGNGTGSSPVKYDYFLRHLASWGFVVVATRDPATGEGATIAQAAAHMVNLGNQSTGPYAGKLDVAHIGAVGHSQGATGAINAMKGSAGTIQTAVAIELPAQVWCGSPANCVDTSTVSAGSVFLVDGTRDLISPPGQAPGTAGLQSIAAYYDAVPASVPKVKGTLLGPDHNDIQGQPACAVGALACTNGAFGYLGYLTAWLMDRLQADAYAHKAFAQPGAEMPLQFRNWVLVDTNVH